MDLSIAICDDDNVFLQEMYFILYNYFSEKKVACEIINYFSAEELIEVNRTFNMIFIDIEMGEINGLEGAKMILEKNNDCFVFFVTSYSIYIDKAFDIKAFRYLSKPIDKNRLYSGINTALEKINEKIKTILVTNNKTKLQIKLMISEILYIENYDRKTKIITKKDDFITAESFRIVKDNIKKEVSYFVLSHQSFFVNLKYVKNYNHSQLKIAYGKKEYCIHISRRKYNEFEKEIFEQARMSD